MQFLKIFRSAGSVATGTAIGQLFVFAATPYLARLYGPTEFGRLGLLTFFASLLMTGVCLRYDSAIPGADEPDARSLTRICLSIAVVFAVGVVIFAALPALPRASESAMVVLDHPFLLASMIVGIALHMTFGANLVREGDFRSYSLLKASQSIFFSVSAASGRAGLLWPYAASFSIGGAALLRGWRRLAGASVVNDWGVAKRFAHFPAYSLSGSMLDVAATNAVIWVITSRYGLADLGHYSQIQRIIGAPMLLACVSLYQVLLKHSADERNAGRSLWPGVKTVAVSLLFLSCALIGVLFFAGPAALRVFLGARWRTDRAFLCLVAVAVCARTVVSPLSNVFIATRRFRSAFVWQVGYFVSSYVLLPWVAGRMDLDRFLRVYAAHEVVQYAMYFALIRQVSLS